MNQVKDIADIKYVNTSVKDLAPEWDQVKKSDGSFSNKIKSLTVNGERFRPTNRFLNSMCSRFGFAPSIYGLFEPDEVFGRISDRKPLHKVRVAIDNKEREVLAVSTPGKPIITDHIADRVLGGLDRTPYRVDYRDGVVTSYHTIGREWKIGPDRAVSQIKVSIPVDGFGLPDIVLGWIRQVCTNGAVAVSPVFRSQVSLGKGADDGERVLMRAIDSFSNEEGFAAISQRVDAASKTPASIAEVASFRRALVSGIKTGMNITDIMNRLERVTGSLSDKYHVPSENALSIKKQRLLNMNCSVAHLINTGSELVTHRPEIFSKPESVYAWIGDRIANEFDLEGEEKRFDNRDFMIVNAA